MPAKPNKRFEWTVATMRDLVLVVLGTGTVVYGLWFVLTRLGRVVLILILALIFTVTLGPLVDRLANRWRRPWAVLVVVVGAVIVIVGGGALLGTLLTGQMVALVRKVPAHVTQLSHLAPGLLAWLHTNAINVNVTALENKILSNAGKFSSFVVSQAVHIVSNVVGGVVDGAIVLFITIYWLLDAERMQTAVLRLVPLPRRDLVLAVERTLTRVVGGYVRGQLLLSAVVGSAFGLGSWMIGLPYPILIGALAGVMELIPLLGPIMGAVMPLLLALLGPNPFVQVPELVVLFAAVHVLESQILGPRIIRSQVGLHPVLSVLALMIGADWQGIWGALFAVPAAGILVAAWVAAVRVWRERVVLPNNSDPAGDPPVVSASSRNIIPKKGV